ncbi:sodium/proline symporter [Luminiphilus syltensis NOR5-1B]|uniref:Sodium/proline symporter n=1 Tax=Luminiphilus syltensis NOR5-1B TaxID=565045 RepID=B8KSH2_9GAMM|nr:sodium/proline symporter [Luminiphilus syltensis]EED36824.1 sodium/proline symporter [Luminiphilus syltensis NOR5-1B]
MDNSPIVAVLLVYLGFMLAIGVWARRSHDSAAGYFLAGRKLPYWIVAFSMNATGESAWLLLGLSGVAYLTGLQALWVVAGETIGVALAWLLVARRLNEQSRENNTITVPDFLSTRFPAQGAPIRYVSVAIILVMACAYIAAQMLATGKAFNVFLGWNYSTGVWVGGLVTVAYTAFGGFKAVAYTDAVQALLMLFALVAIPVVGIAAIGGPTELWHGLQAIDPRLLIPWSVGEGKLVAVVAIASALAVGLPFLGVPQLLVRFMATRDTRDVPRAAAVSIVVIILFDVGAVATGLVGRILFPSLGDAEQVMPVLAQELFSPIVTGVLVVAVLSAVMSTVSSLLNLASSALVHDIYRKVSQRSGSSRREAIIGQWVTLALGIAGCLVALVQDGFIFSLVLFAWSGLGAAFGPVMLCTLRWSGTTGRGVIAGMIAGFFTSVTWALLAKSATFGLYEMIPASVASLLATVLVSRATAVDDQVGEK